MTERQEYYLGITLSYMVGALLTLPFLVFIAIVRIVMCIGGVLYDTFMFTPRVVIAYQYRHWEKQIESGAKNTHLN